MTAGKREVLRAAVLLALPGLFCSCVSVPPSVQLSTPRRVSVKDPRVAWVAPVTFADPEMEETVRADGLTLSIVRYLRQSGRFADADTLSDARSPGDLVLHWTFIRYRQSRSVHPAYVPCAVLTLTLYIFFNGPVGIDETDLAASLTIEDGQGRELAHAEEEVSAKHSFGVWSDRFALPSGIEGRTALVEALLARCVDTLAENP